MTSRATPLQRGFGWLITLLIPPVLLMTAIRLLLIPAFLPIEYHTPGFPADTYGFTLQDRLHWSRYAVDYLLNDAGISYLGDLRFADGGPVFNERELSHMLDVKNLVQAALKGWVAALILLAGLALWAWRGRWLRTFRAGVWRGGWLTVGMIVAILALVVTNFSALFTGFHRIFFTGNTWIFLYSDTLIRLFPIRFWQDCFIYIGAFCLIIGLIFGLALGPKRPAPEEKSLLQDL